MMKRLIVINGTMGAGKTAVSRELLSLLPPAAFLDGDWCWTMNPFQVTEETKRMVLDNITCVLQNFLACPAYETVIFCWVLHQREILQELLARLALDGVETRCFTLMLCEETLERHLRQDIAAGLRTPGILARSRERLPLYAAMETEKLWIDGCTARETAQQLAARLERPAKGDGA